MLPVHVFVISKPGSDVDGEDHLIEGATAEEIAETKAMRERVYKYTLTLVGTKVGVRFTPVLPYESLPRWAQRIVDEQTPKHLARRERPARRKAPRVA